LGTNTLSGDIKKAFSGAEASGKSAGAGAGKGFLSGFKGLVGAGVALAGAGIFSGFIAEAARASDATDKFMATMDFAGLDTKAIDAAKNAAKSYADQTVYDLPTIQNTLAQLASNGVSDYTGLTKAAGNLNAVAGGNADTFKSVAMVMTQTAGAGKLTTENWNQMADAIPGAAGPLMKSLKEAGAYTGNFRDAMAAGEISSDEFNASLMKLGTDPVAVEAAKSTKTFEGALGSLSATINSGLMGALDAMKPAITGAINGVSAGLSKIFGFIGGLFAGMKSLIMDGDITPTLLKSLGVEEDSPIIGGLLFLQDKFWAVFRGIQDFITGFTFPSILGPESMGFNKFAAAGVKVHGFLLDMKGWFQDFWAGLTMPSDVAASMGAPLDGVVKLGATVRDVFDKVVAAISPLVAQIIPLVSAFSPMQIVFAAIQPLLPQLMGMFGQLASVLGGSLLTILTALTPMFVQLSGVVSDALGGVIATVLPTVVTMITMLGTTLSQLIPIIVPIITTLVQLATTLISQLMPIITSLVSSILPPLVDIFGNILSAIGPVVSMVAGLLIPIIQALMPVVVTVFGVIASVITSAMQIVQGIIQVVTGIISGNWAQVWSGILNILSGAIGLLINIISGAFQLVISVIGAALRIVVSVFTSAWSGIVNYLTTAFLSIVNGASGMGQDLLNFFGGLGGKIVGALGGIGSTLFSTGQNIIQGLINGIGSMMGAIGRAVISIVPEAIRGPFEQLLGIHSPSRVFLGYGVNIGQGLINGIDGMSGKIESAVTGMVSIPPVPSFGSGSYTASLGASSGSMSPAVNVYVGNEQLDARTYRVASSAISAADSQSQFSRRGR
jgi:tape measure domain-containing protein